MQTSPPATSAFEPEGASVTPKAPPSGRAWYNAYQQPAHSASLAAGAAPALPAVGSACGPAWYNGYQPAHSVSSTAGAAKPPATPGSGL